MTNVKLIDLIQKTHPKARMHVGDKNYAEPSEKWLLGKFNSWFHFFLNSMGIDSWESKFDCDNFAGLFTNLCAISHQKTSNTKQGIAVGQIWYPEDGGGGHAIIFYVHNGKLKYLEPQHKSNPKKELSSREKEGAWLLMVH